MMALHEQQKLLENNDNVLEEESAEIKIQQVLIAVLEEKLRLKDLRLFGGASSEKKLSQLDWLADEAEQLADGEPDPAVLCHRHRPT